MIFKMATGSKVGLYQNAQIVDMPYAYSNPQKSKFLISKEIYIPMNEYILQKRGYITFAFLLKVVNETDEAKKAAEDEEAKTMTLDEWKAQQGGSKDQPKFNIRKAGEGSDLDPKWKKTYAYKKEKETHEDDEDEVKKYILK